MRRPERTHMVLLTRGPARPGRHLVRRQCVHTQAGTESGHGGWYPHRLRRHPCRPSCPCRLPCGGMHGSARITADSASCVQYWDLISVSINSWKATDPDNNEAVSCVTHHNTVRSIPIIRIHAKRITSYVPSFPCRSACQMMGLQSCQTPGPAASLPPPVLLPALFWTFRGAVGTALPPSRREPSL